jgi:hypothetical protein
MELNTYEHREWMNYNGKPSRKTKQIFICLRLD